MRYPFFPLLLFFGWSHAGSAFAGSVITTNLPSNVEIININAQQDGAASYGGGSTGQAYWYQPFGSGPDGLLSVPVSAGTYTFRIIDPADAQAAFPSLTAGQLSSIYTAWTFNSPWITQFMIFDISATTNASEPQLLDGAGGGSLFGDAQSAYNDAVNNNYAGRLRLASEQSPSTPGREGTVFETTYTVTTATSLVFIIPDYYLPDNNGGVSVVMTQVPEPKTLALLATASLALAGCQRRRVRCSVTSWRELLVRPDVERPTSSVPAISLAA